MKSGFDAMRFPIPHRREQEAYKWLTSLGFATEKATLIVGTVGNELEMDRPYQAQKLASEYLDLTGVYRLIAILLTNPPGDKDV